MNIKFDNYDIDLDVLNQDLAEYIPTYLDSKRWAKDPEARTKWNLAYDNINSRGITGFSTNNGRYSLSHNGLEFDDPEGYYADAANVIINRAKNILNTSKAKEVEPENLEEFGRFLDRLGAYIMNTNYGGDSNLMRRHWNSMDSHDEYELYETTKRKAALKKALQDYKATLEDNKYSFEGTSYKDLNDLKFKIDAAIASLDNPNNTDYTALHQLGIDENLWFPTNEEAANEARTAAEEKLELENKAKQAQEIALANQKRANQYTSYRFFNISKLNGTPPSGNDVETRLSGYASLPKLNAQQQSELVGAFKYAKKKGLLLNLDKDELSKFGDIYINNPTRLKKVKGINGFYYDSIGNRIIQPFQGTAPLLSLLDVVNENSPENLEKSYLQSKIPGLTNGEEKELLAIALDIASIINPEAITGSAMALGAAELRRRAKNETPGHKWDFWEIVGQGVDYLTGALGGVQVAGDAILGTKAAILASKITPILLKIARVGAWKDLFDGAPGTVTAIEKAIKGEELTVEDWRNIGQGIRGLVSHGRLSRNNLTERKVIEKSGYTKEQLNASKGKVRQYAEQTGFVRTKIPEGTINNKVTTIKAKVNNESKEIDLTPEAKNKLDSEIKKAGNNEAKRNEAVSKVLKDEKLMGKGKALKESDNITVEKPSTIDRSIFGLRAPERLRTARNLFGERTVETLNVRENDNFEQWLQSRTAFDKWNPFGLGSNTKLRNIRERIGLNNNSSNTQSNSNNPTENSSNTNLSTEQLNTNTYSYRRETMSRYKDATNGRFGNSPIESGSIKVGGNGDLKVELKDGTYNVYFKENKLGNVRNQAEVQKIVSNVIKQLNKKDSQFGKVSAKEMGEILRSLKAKGWLRHGGKLIKA